MTEAKVNYTEELTAEVISRYSEGETDEARAQILNELSEDTGKSVKSLRAKLVREGVYVKKTYVSKATGDKPETKETIVASLATILGLPVAALEGLDKATKKTLNLLRDTIRDASEEAIDES